MTNIRGTRLLILLVTWCVSYGVAGAQTIATAHTDYDVLLEQLELRPGLTADVRVKVFVNETAPCVGRTVLAVPGFAHTADTFEGLANAMFARDPAGHYACRMAAIDLPGHGQSGAPAPAGSFSGLFLDDYVTAVLGALDRLPQYGLRPGTVLAHSQGALVVQLAQQRLAIGGTSLRDAYNVQHVVFLAPVPPQQVFWGFADSGVAATVLSGFVAADPALGAHFALPDAAWGPIFFSNLAGDVAPAVPAAADVARYNAPEPLLGALELVGALAAVGLPPTPRRGVDAGIFSAEAGSRLQVVSFANDQIIRPQEAAGAYAHLTGDFSAAGVVEVGGDYSVHDTYVSDPDGLLTAIADAIRLR